MASLDKKQQKAFGNFSFVPNEKLLLNNPIKKPNCPSPQNDLPLEPELDTLFLKKGVAGFFKVNRAIPYQDLALFRKELMDYFKANGLLENHPRKGLNLSKYS